ncbi:hypothetical protein HanXRQr2_Chr06g0277391 [Helianthus annuus]|uniref:Uncharacterized protein n=1 Tax=Helianthus annuus TaxID=4232 RepID=A0A9K3NLC7_HELAN|nr:hypothetical protein HanXRQr2_Chr06g0277391 [Helianthus annuus]
MSRRAKRSPKFVFVTSILTRRPPCDAAGVKLKAPRPPFAQSAEGRASRNHGSFSLNCAVVGRSFCKSE